MRKIEFKPSTPYLWLLFFLWVLYGQAVAYGVSEGLLRGFAHVVWDSALRYVPSVMRIKDEYAFDGQLARMMASVMLMSMPILFLLMLLANVEDSWHGVREKNKESEVVLLLVFVASLIFLAGFGVSHQTRIFSHSVYGYAVQAAFLTYISSFGFRIAFCLAFKR